MDDFGFLPLFDHSPKQRFSLPYHQPDSNLLISKSLQYTSGMLLVMMLVDLHHIFLPIFSSPDLHLPPFQPILKLWRTWEIDR